MRITNSLDRLFASGGHLAVLRALWNNRRSDLTGREIAKVSRLSSSQTANVLRALQDEGLALSRPAGRAFFWRWNENHLWATRISGLFEAEAGVRNELIEDLRVTFRGLPVKEVRLFGSMAEGDARVDSDIDLYVETSDARASQSVRDALSKRAPRFWMKYGNPVAPLVLTTKEVRELPNRGLIDTIRRQGIGIAPTR